MWCLGEEINTQGGFLRVGLIGLCAPLVYFRAAFFVHKC